MAAKARAAAKAAMGKKGSSSTAGATASKADGGAKAEALTTLPPKDQKAFKEILSLYETKQYRKGLKACDALLKKYPEHGETLAMQGLLHHCLNDKALGYELVKKGVRASLKSHVVWHVYGIITRADRDYGEALKCFSQAHRLDPENLHILRDLSLLQIQLRQFGSYVVSRHQYLRANWKTRQHWLGLAVAYHLNSQPSDALDVLLALEDAQTEIENKKYYEISEATLFTAEVALAIPEKREWALEYIEERTGRITDRTAYMVMRARILAELGRTEAAEWAWTALLDLNSDSLEFIKGYLSLKGHSLSGSATTDASRSDTLNSLQSLSSRYPKSLLLQRLVLDYSTGDAFRAAVDAYLLAGIQRGVPSLFTDVKSLCSDQAKDRIVGELVEGYRATLESGKPIGDSKPASDEDDEAPSSYLWTLYFLSQLYSLRGDQALALSTIDLALLHTPTLADIYMTRARFLKRAGSPSLAAIAINEARRLDGQDRYLNGKCAKYMLREGRNDDAKEVVGLFTRREAPDPVADLVDMQALWYVVEDGEAWQRKGRTGLALKRFHQVAEVFSTWVEDQFDFHSYCIRKGTLRVYLDLLPFEDTLYDHPQYLRAAKAAIAIYLDIFDRRTAGASAGDHSAEGKVNGINGELANGDAVPESDKSESKKALKKAKQAEAKAKAAAAAEAKKAASQPPSKQDGDLIPPPPDKDPEGEKLAATDEPLEQALIFWKPLGSMAKKNVETWLLAFEIQLRRGKPLLAVQAIRQALELAPLHPRTHVALARLFTLDTEQLDSSVRQAFGESLQALTSYDSINAANKALIEANPGSPAHLLAASEALAVTKGEVAEVERLVFDELLKSERATWRDAVDALSVLRQVGSSRIEQLREEAGKRWDLAEAFWTDDVRRQRLEKARTGSLEDQMKEQEAAKAEPEASQNQQELIDP